MYLLHAIAIVKVLLKIRQVLKLKI